MIYVISAGGRFEQQRREDAMKKLPKAKFGGKSGFTCQVNLTPQRQGAQSAHERFVIGLCLCINDFVPAILLGGTHMHSNFPAIVFLLLGVTFIAFNKLVIAGIHWLDRAIWNEERRRRFPGHGGNQYAPWMAVLLGASWIACAIFFWFTSK